MCKWIYSSTRGPRAPTLNCSNSVDLISSPGVPGSEIFCMWEVCKGLISMRTNFEIHPVTEGGGVAFARNTAHNACVKSAWRPSNGGTPHTTTPKTWHPRGQILHVGHPNFTMLLNNSHCQVPMSHDKIAMATVLKIIRVRGN